MLHRIIAIALNTYREAVRQKVLYILVVFTALLIVFSLFLGQLSLGADTKIIKDMTLASMMIFGALVSIFVGIGLLFKEVDRRTIYTILAKPVSRAEFVMGKFAGLSMTVGLKVIVMTVLMYLVLSLYREPLDWHLLKAVVLIYVELCILIAATLFFSAYSSAFMSAVFAVAFLVIGHLTDDFAALMTERAYQLVRQAESILDTWGAYALLGLVEVLQNFSLDHFVINAKVVHGVPISWAWVLNAVFYGVCWLVVLLMGSVFLFKRKDLQ